MASIKEVEDLIRRKNWHFEVASSMQGNRYGKQTLQTVADMHGSLQEYLAKIARRQNNDSVGIQLLQPNGTSFIKRDFFLLRIEPGVVSTNPIAPSTPPVVEPMGSVDAPAQPKPKMEDVKALIENGTLKTEVRFLNQQVDDLKSRNKHLEKQNDDLNHEVTKLTRELGSTGDKLALDFKKREIEIMQESKRGLAGVMDDLKSLPPEAWHLAASLMNKKLPVTGQNAIEGVSSSLEKHADNDAQTAIEALYNLLIKQPPAVIGMIVALGEYFCRYPDHLAISFNKFFPQQQIQPADPTKGVSGNDDEEEED